MSSTATGSTTDSSQPDSRVLCCFGDQSAARPYESALIKKGVSLLRARHGMHAYWLAIASKPAMAIVDARGMDLERVFLLTRINKNAKLSGMRVLVMTDQELPIDSEQFVAVPANILPTDLAARVGDLVEELTLVNQSTVDEFFSLWDDAPATQEFAPPVSSFLRADGGGDKPTANAKNHHDARSLVDRSSAVSTAKRNTPKTRNALGSAFFRLDACLVLEERAVG